MDGNDVYHSALLSNRSVAGQDTILGNGFIPKSLPLPYMCKRSKKITLLLHVCIPFASRLCIAAGL
jgi:hypothetical protein